MSKSKVYWMCIKSRKRHDNTGFSQAGELQFPYIDPFCPI
jgi:hypothetical protein